MSWNGSQASKDCQNGSTKSQMRPNRHGLTSVITGLVLIIVCIVLYVHFKSEEKLEDTREEPKDRQIAERQANHSVSTNQVVEVVKKDSTEKKRKELEAKIYKDEKGISRYPGGLRVQKGPVKKVDISMPTRKKMLFKTLFENELAAILTVQPGEAIFGPTLTGSRLERELQRSLKTPIVDNQNDTPEEKALKDQVRLIKKELAQRMANGEDISQVLAEARQDIQEAYQYRQTLAAELAKIKKDPSYTDKDIVDFVNVANEMLEKKGISVNKFRPGFRNGMKLSIKEDNKDE